MNPRTLLGAATAACLAVALPIAVGNPGQAADGPTTVLSLEFNEPAGSQTAVDSSGFGHDGAIGSHVKMNGAWADWDRHPPGEGIYYGADHLVMVPDAADGSLDPESSTFTVEFRFRSTDKFGNILQKGQARTAGGQVKFQQPKGFVSCMFKSPSNQASIKSSIATNDGQWHVIRCVRTTADVTLYVDGVFNKRIRKVTSSINNVKPWTIGGKFDCDTSDPDVGADSCDYFPGDIDYVHLTKG
jgi:hypothetical protein